MARRENRPRRLITKVRRQVGRETLVHRQKNKYNRRRHKAKTRQIANKYIRGAEEWFEGWSDDDKEA